MKNLKKEIIKRAQVVQKYKKYILLVVNRAYFKLEMLAIWALCPSYCSKIVSEQPVQQEEPLHGSAEKFKNVFEPNWSPSPERSPTPLKSVGGNRIKSLKCKTDFGRHLQLWTAQ